MVAIFLKERKKTSWWRSSKVTKIFINDLPFWQLPVRSVLIISMACTTTVLFYLKRGGWAEERERERERERVETRENFLCLKVMDKNAKQVCEICGVNGRGEIVSSTLFTRIKHKQATNIG